MRADRAVGGRANRPARRPNGRVVYSIDWEASVRPEVAGLGHALASRYGAGAPGTLTRALLGIGSGF